MQQASLIVFADIDISWKRRQAIKEQLLNASFSSELEEYRATLFLLTNREQKLIDEMVVLEEDAQVIVFQIYEIQIRLTKNQIQLNFPFLFRAICDFDRIRNAVFALLRRLLSFFSTKQIIFCPSCWQQYPYEITNSYQEKRMEILQQKIVQQGNSFKRTLNHLKYVLGDPSLRWKDVIEKTYRSYLLLDWC